MKRTRIFCWAFQNWRRGLRFDAVARCRYCDHTHPFHYETCRLSKRAKAIFGP